LLPRERVKRRVLVKEVPHQTFRTLKEVFYISGMHLELVVVNLVVVITLLAYIMQPFYAVSMMPYMHSSGVVSRSPLTQADQYLRLQGVDSSHWVLYYDTSLFNHLTRK
jgi:hypothetical protein